MAQAAKTENQSVAALLKVQRQKQKLSIEAVSDDICVRRCFLEALEDERYSELPELTFALGFVKAYAKALKLNQCDVAEQFKHEFLANRDAAASTASAPSVTEPSSKHAEFNRNYKFSVKPRRRWPAWLSPIVGLAGAALSWMWLGASSVTVTSTASIDPTTDARVLAALSEPLSAIEETASDVPEMEVAPRVTKDQKSTGSLFIPAVNASTEEPEGPATSSIVIEAAEDSWLQLSYGNGTELWSGVLRSGQTYQPQLVGDVFLTTSNAGGILLRQFNVERGPLGKRGEVLEGFDLTGAAFAEDGRRERQNVASITDVSSD